MTKTYWNKTKNEKRLKNDDMILFKIFVNSKALFTCQICKKNEIDDMHHLLFGSYGADKDDRTIIGVCRECHEWCHKHKHESQARYMFIADRNWKAFQKYYNK